MSENTGNESSGAVGLLDEFLTVERVRQEPERRMPDGSMNDLKSMFDRWEELVENRYSRMACQEFFGREFVDDLNDG